MYDLQLPYYGRSCI